MTTDRLATAVADQRALAEAMFDELRANTFDGVGITRASYGEGEEFAHHMVERYARELGLEITRDAAGNTYMTMPGADRSKPKIVIGSHLDSVAQGGNFDGAAGVVAGLTALAGLKAAGITPPRDVSIMGIRAEESAWFGVSYIGSRSALGTLPPGALDNARRADTNRTLAEHMTELGYRPDELRNNTPYLRPANIHAYLELHIEQGPVLEAGKLPVGVVTGIRGNRRLPAARCIGEYSHCGGVPRSHRKDAVLGVSDLVQALDAICDETEATGEDFAFTVGKFGTDPEWHAMTKIAGEVRFSLDFRSLSPSFLEGMETRLSEIVKKIEAKRGVTFELGDFTRAAPGLLSDGIKNSLREGTQELGQPTFDIPSGASHDCAAFAAAGVPSAMIFVRNDKGSHNPDEAMEIPDFMEGTKLMAWWIARQT